MSPSIVIIVALADTDGGPADMALKPAVLRLARRERGEVVFAEQQARAKRSDADAGQPEHEAEKRRDQDQRQPYASPLFAEDHSGLPPALVQVAEHDPIRDDGLRYTEVLRAAGVPVRLTQYVGMPHGFASFPRICRAAPQALAELCEEQRTVLGR